MKIAIISDIHEDITSLTKAARLIEKQHCDEIICLGDIVGFSVPFYDYFDTRNASACVAWVKRHCRYVLAGNHDLFAVRKLPRSEVRGFTFTENWYDLPFHVREGMALGNVWLYEDNELSALLSEEAREYLAGLPESLIIEADGRQCLLTHSIYPDITGSARRFLTGFHELTDHLAFMARHDCRIGFSGHIHCNGMIRQGNQEIISTGFGRSIPVQSSMWIGVPAISNSKNANGFLIWDTMLQTLEAIPLKKKISMLKRERL